MAGSLVIPGSEAAKMPRCNFYGSILEFLLARCPPFSFSPPWNFLQADNDCRGPVPDPAKTLNLLRAEFPDSWLYRSGVLRQDSAGEPCLAPELINPVGGIVALRDDPLRTPFALLTSRGCLPRKYFPVAAARRDCWTVQKLAKNQVLFATPRIGEVALLRALGLPATLTTGIAGLSLVGFRYLDGQFGCEDAMDSAPTREPSQRSTNLSPAADLSISLALVGWSPWSLALKPSPLLSHPVGGLTKARRHLGLLFAGVMAWRLSSHDWDTLLFRLKYKDPQLVCAFMQEKAHSLIDFEQLTQCHDGATSEQAVLQVGYMAARQELSTLLADDREAGGSGQRLRRAQTMYEAMVERDLLQPLQAWALASDDPVLRNAGIELADISGLLHRLSPLLVDLYTSLFERLRSGDVDPIPNKVFSQYVALVDRFSRLIGDLCKWRNA